MLPGVASLRTLHTLSRCHSVSLSISHLFAALDPLGPATVGVRHVYAIYLTGFCSTSSPGGAEIWREWLSWPPPKTVSCQVGLLEPVALGLGGGVKEEMEKDIGRRTKLERWQLG